MCATIFVLETDLGYLGKLSSPWLPNFLGPEPSFRQGQLLRLLTDNSPFEVFYCFKNTCCMLVLAQMCP